VNRRNQHRGRRLLQRIFRPETVNVPFFPSPAIGFPFPFKQIEAEAATAASL
jgi:hypothetical protein